VVTIAYVVLALWCIVWAVRDARDRGHEAAAWAIFFVVVYLIPVLPMHPPRDRLLLGVLTWACLPIYLLCRRPGVLAECEHCANRRLLYVRRCPHCGRE
jgi:hypothetical protein